MNKKIYHFAKCPGSQAERCRWKVRLTITEKDYGKKVAVKCPKCDVEFTTTLVRPIETPKKETKKPDGPFEGFKWPFP